MSNPSAAAQALSGLAFAAADVLHSAETRAVVVAVLRDLVYIRDVRFEAGFQTADLDAAGRKDEFSEPGGRDSPLARFRYWVGACVAAAQRIQTVPDAYRKLFEQEAFPLIAEALLSEVAPKWASGCSEQEQRELIDEWFLTCNPMAALVALTGHLSVVQEVDSPGGDRVSVTAEGAGKAASLLAQRFGPPDGHGVMQLLAEQVAAAAAASPAPDVAHVAAQLASLPDRVLQLPRGQQPRSLAAKQLLPAVLQQVGDAIVLLAVGGDAAVRAAAAAAASRSLEELLVQLVARWCARGLAREVAEGLAAWLEDHLDGGGGCEADVSEARRERLLLLWRRLMPADPGSGSGGLPGCVGSSSCAGEDRSASPSRHQLVGNNGWRQGGEAALAVALAESGAGAALLRRNARVCRSLLAALPQAAAAQQVLAQVLAQAARPAAGGGVLALHCLVGPGLDAGGCGGWAEEVLTNTLVTQPKLPPAALTLLAARLAQLDAWGGQLPGSCPAGEGGWRARDGVLYGSEAAQARLRNRAEGGGADWWPERLAAPAPQPLPSGSTPGWVARAAECAARVWGCQASVRSASPSAQAYVTAALMLLMRAMGSEQLQLQAALTTSVLEGVSVRLNSATPSVRRQGMRVGRLLSMLLAASEPAEAKGSTPEGEVGLLFAEFDLGLLAEERWHDDAESACDLTSPAPPELQLRLGVDPRFQGSCQEAVPAAAEAQNGGVVTDSDDSDAASLAALEDEEGERQDEADAKLLGADGAPIQLRAVVAALRKADDVEGVLKHLSVLELLVRSQPDELSTYAADLTRALISVRVPEWAETDANTPEEAPNACRLRALVALAAQEDQAAAAALLDSLYQTHLDVSQRLLVLDTLDLAAREMAARPGLPPSTALLDRFLPSGVGSSNMSSQPPRSGAAPQSHPGRRRVFAPLSLAKGAAAARPRVTRNRFVSVARQWMAGLLAECDRPRQACDLFGRDFLVLGRLLVTIGSFCNCVAGTHAAAPLAAASLEVLAAPAVHSHPEPFVRRCAVASSAQVVAAVPAARLAGAMLGREDSDAEDGALMDRLDWLRSWHTDVAASDSDSACRKLAAAALACQRGLAQEALAHLEETSARPPSHSSQRLSVEAASALSAQLRF